MRTKPRYGLDTPGVMVGLLVSCVFSIALAWVILHYFASQYPTAAWGFFWIAIVMALFNLGEIVLLIYSSLKGRKKMISYLFQVLELKGKEKALELESRTGIMLATLAKTLPEGHISGTTSHSVARIEKNLALEDTHNASIQAAKMQELPFEKGSFDVVFTCLSLRHIEERQDREKALIEAVRVLKPGGKIAIIDCQKMGEHQETLRHLGCQNITLSARYFCMFPPVRILHAKAPTLSL